jgi:ABC-2 type transport system ATP-binding protein
MSDPVVQVEHLTHRYSGDRVALKDVSLAVNEREIFGFLGPNGSGKTTLFRILSTLIPPSGTEQDGGRVSILSFDAIAHRQDVRRNIGVVFQAPSLDKQLTAEENLRHHGHLYGLRGRELKARIDQMLSALGLTDRARERVGTFSGGMRRRVELAKGMLTGPRVLLLDEPSTGLDPSARIDLWSYLTKIRDEQGVTVLLTTHLMDEGDRCDRLAILDRGILLACDTPAAMKARIGGDVITLATDDPQRAGTMLREKLSVEPDQVDATLRLERPNGAEFVPRLIEALPAGMVNSISVGKPTLEDVFVQLTGHRFRDEETALAASQIKKTSAS